uniref:UDP-glycosyltransferase 85C2-like n=1 Tax=Tanacetum cinerariifolium TaxID=118510 RepID=A0A6L2L2J0_TANCI|nr:UDP-glycosyltransferase 85C2-like [Tanacetum cinerariifolium]
MEGIRLKDLNSILWTTDPNNVLLTSCTKVTQKSHDVSHNIFHTFDALEPSIVDALSSMYPKVYTVGPMQLLLNQMPKQDKETEFSYSLWKEEAECFEWLDSKEPNSVMYVNYGSLAVMSLQDLIEFAWGLVNSNHYFLWIIRSNLVEGESIALPHELEKLIETKGFIARWCSQEKVLNHPSVGGFLTHCGWGSTIESLSVGVPMICWPYAWDQLTNCRYICEEWGVGLEMGKNVKRKEVKMLVQELMGEGGHKMRNKAAEWKEQAHIATSPNGSSTLNVDKLPTTSAVRNTAGKGKEPVTQNREERKNKKLKEPEARLNFEGCSGTSRYSESKTMNTKKHDQRDRSRCSCRPRTSVFSRIRRDRSRSLIRREWSRSPRQRAKEGGVFKRLGSRGKSVSARLDSYNQHNHLRYTKALSESEDNGVEEVHQRPHRASQHQATRWRVYERFREKVQARKKRCQGGPECMRISGFVHGITNPELIKRLNDKIPKTVNEMMRVTTSFLRGEFHGEVGHNTDECMLLRKQKEEMLKEEKLSHLIKEIKQNNGKEQPKERVARQRITQSFSPNLEIFFPPLGKDEGTEGPMIIEAEIGGHCIHRMYVDGGSASEIMYEHFFSRLCSKIKKQLIPATTPLIGFSGEIIWSIGKIQLLVKIRDEEHSALAWMNFMVVRSQSPYNRIIGRPGFRKLQAFPSTAHGMLKIPVEAQLGHFCLEACGYDRRPKTHRLNVRGGCFPVRQKKREQAADKSQTIQEEVEKLVGAGIMREVHYHDWLSNPMMVKKYDGSWMMFVDFKDLNKACPKDGYLLPDIDWKVESLNAEATYQRLVDKAFHNQIGRNLEVYVDDLVIKSRTEDEIFRDVEEAFKTLREINTKLNPKKCAFGVEEGIRIQRCAKIKRKTRKPEKVLGQISREIISFFKTLKKCTRKSDFHWTTEAEEAFKQMKQLIAEFPMLTALMEKEELIVYLAATKETPADMTGVPRHIAKHRLNVRGGCFPVRQKKREQAADKSQTIQEEVEKLVGAGIMREVHYHDWLSNPMMVKKYDGSWMMFVDFKDLNKACPKDGYLLPDIDWKVESLNAEATYQRLVDKAFHNQIGRNLEVYVDDLVIKSRTEDEIFRDVEEAFKTLREINTKLNPKKELRGPELNYMSMEKLVLALVHASKRLKRPRVSVKGKILADFVVKRPEEDSPDTPIEEEGELPEPWILFTDRCSCTDCSGAGLILTNPEGMKFTYALRFRFDATNNEAECEALIAGLRVVEQMGVKNLQANVDSRLVANQVNETYVAKEADMIRYLEKVKALTGSFKAFSIKQIPRSENKKADALSKIASTSFAHLSKQVLVEELKEKSISEVEILAVVEEEGDT